MTPDYSLLHKIGYNDPTRSGMLRNTYYVTIAQRLDTPYYITLYWGEQRLGEVYVANDLDQVCFHIKDLEAYIETINVVYYIDWCDVNDK